MKRQANSYTIKVYSETLPGDVIDRKRDNEEDIGEEDLITELEDEGEFDNLYEIVDWLDRETGFNLEGDNGSYYTVDTNKDMYTGDEVNYSYHLDGLDRDEISLVDKCVKEGKNLIPDPTDFDTDEEWEVVIQNMLKGNKAMNLKTELVKIARLLEGKENNKTFKCPECGTKVLENTGYCVKCKKKVKKASSNAIILEKTGGIISVELTGYFSGAEYTKAKSILTEGGFKVVPGKRGRIFNVAIKSLEIYHNIAELKTQLRAMGFNVEDRT